MLEHLKNEMNTAYTENGAKAYRTTNSAVLDFFAHAGSMRGASENELTTLFIKAYSEDPLLATKALFYMRDIRGGQGERRLFHVLSDYMAKYHPEAIEPNLSLISEYGRWDDLISLISTPLCTGVKELIRNQLVNDTFSDHPSLLAKWMPSCNASSSKTRKFGRYLASLLDMDERIYRKTLSSLRKKIGLVEQKMSTNNWNTIDYPKVPSRAGLIYRNAFSRHDPSGYEDFIQGVNDGTQKINTGVLYPHEIVKKFFPHSWGDAERPEDCKVLETMWNNLPDYLNGNKSSALAVVDTSGSMTSEKCLPISVALSLGIYFAERIQGEFHNYFITFSSQPELQHITGSDLYEKISGMCQAGWENNTDIEAVFDLVLKTAVKNNLPKSELPDKIFIFSDMEFDESTSAFDYYQGRYIPRVDNKTLFEIIKDKYKKKGYEMPELVFWNLSARHNQFPVKSTDYGMTLVSGFSPSIMANLLAGKDMTPYTLMLDVLNSDRYKPITVVG